MKIEAMRDMNEQELNNEVLKLKQELFNLRFQHVTGQLDNPNQMKSLKKDIARLKTVIREKQLQAEA